MTSKTEEFKALDGLVIGEFDDVFVSEDVLIQGNLTVNGTITGGAGPSTDNYYVATDSTNQFRANSGTVDMQSTSSSTPTFSFKNNAGNTASSTLAVGQVNTVNLQSTGISNSGTINTGTVTAGTANATTANVTGTTTTGTLAATTSNVTTENATTINVAGTTTTGTLAATTGNITTLNVSGATATGSIATTLDTQSTSISTGAIVTPGGLGVAKATHIGGQLHCTSTAASTSTTTGSARFSGGIGVAGAINVGGEVNATGAATIENLTANAISILYLKNDTGTANGVIFKNGSTRVGDGDGNTMTIRNDAGKLRLYDNTGTGFVLDNGTITSPSSLSTFSLTTASGITGATLNSTGNTSVGGNLTVAGTTTLNDPLVQNDPMDADDASPGSVFTWGGLKAVKKVYAQGGLVIPYGQPIQANTAFGTKAKMMQSSFSLSGGLPGDALYLFTPGSSSQASTDYVLGVNADACKLPQTTASTSTTTGALQVAGGVGIAGNLNVGGSITGGSVSYANTSSGTFSITNGTGTTLTVASTTSSSSPTTGSATFAGGVGIAGNLNVAGTITGGSISYSSTSTGTLNVTDATGRAVLVNSTEESTGTTTGSIVTAGGAGIGKNASIGGNVLLGLVPTNGIRYHAMYNSSTDPGAGISIVFDTAAAGFPPEIIMLGPNHPTDPNNMIIRNPAGNLLLYGSGNAGLYVGSSVTFCQLPFLVQNTNDAIAYNNASMLTSGGLGVTKSVRIGGNVVSGDIATDGVNSITVSNQSAGSNAYAAITLDTQAVGNANIFMNGPNRTADGGANTLTMRNDAGDVRLQSTTSTLYLKTSEIESSKFKIVDTTESSVSSNGSFTTLGGVGIAKNCNVGGNLSAVGSFNANGQSLFIDTTQSTSPSTGGVTMFGGLGVSKNVNVGGVMKSETEVRVQRTGAAEMSVYNNGSTTEWLFGQRSASDHDFTISSKVGATVTPMARLNTSGQLKLGLGAFFNYFEGSWTPTIDYTSAAPTSITYNQQYGRYTVIGKTVTLTYSLKFDYGLGATGSYFLIRGIPPSLALSTQDEVTQVTFRGTFAGISNPFYTTLWKAGYNLPGVAVFDGLTMTIGAYNSGSYITGAYQAFGAGGQEMWGTLTYQLP